MVIEKPCYVKNPQVKKSTTKSVWKIKLRFILFYKCKNNYYKIKNYKFSYM